MAPDHINHSTTDGPSRLRLFYGASTYLEAAKQADLSPILNSLSLSPKAGRPELSRTPMVLLYFLSRSRQTDVPRKIKPLIEWLKADPDRATLCGFDDIPSESTIRRVFAKLDALKNEVRIVTASITKLLREKQGKPKRQARGKPKAIKKGIKRKADRDRQKAKVSRRRVPLKRKRNWRKSEDYRKSRLNCALGIFQFTDMIPDDEAAEHIIVNARWPDGEVVCPELNCHSQDVVELRGHKRRTWSCRRCGRRFNALTCTTLQGVQGPWRLILLAIYSCLQFSYTTGLSLACALKTDDRQKAHKTGLSLQHRIFQAMEEELPRLSDTTQFDDTLVGTIDDVPVNVRCFLDNESGEVRTAVLVGEINQENSTQAIKDNTTEDVLLLTDQSDDYPYGFRKRLTVNHSVPEMARWDKEHQVLVMTNGVEGFWSLLKLLLLLHRAVTLRHLYLYVAAATWHINHLREPIVDQMRALIRNSHQVWARPEREAPEDLLDFQLELQPSEAAAAPKPEPSPRRRSHAAHSHQARPRAARKKHDAQSDFQLKLQTFEAEVASKPEPSSRRRSRAAHSNQARPRPTRKKHDAQSDFQLKLQPSEAATASKPEPSSRRRSRATQRH